MEHKPKQETFFYGYITASFFPFETFEKDDATLALESRLKIDLKASKSKISAAYPVCELMIYVEDMSFRWPESVPEEYKAIEIWWKKVKAGEPLLDTFLYWAENVPNHILAQFWEAKKKAHLIWKPTEEKSPNDQDEEEKQDPNS